ncbi:hypothetical protein KUCAC02_016433 [Chaenocephalus aceratus]|nr:hypothetical protein KUCAC02_016433 [Chaenocephalus aceratus]
MYKSKRPNKAAVAHLINLEFESRRRFITSEVLKEQDKPTQILEAYRCFRELDHVMDELQRIIQPKNSRYILEVKDRWETFYSKGPVLWCDEASKNLEWSGACHSCVHSPATSLPIEHCATKEAGHQQGGSLPYPDDFRRPRNVPALAAPVVSSCAGL